MHKSYRATQLEGATEASLFGLLGYCRESASNEEPEQLCLHGVTIARSKSVDLVRHARSGWTNHGGSNGVSTWERRGGGKRGGG
jgi:hypothetical protein